MMRTFFLLFLLSFLIQSAFAQVELRLESLPASTPANSSFYAAGSFNNWNPASPQHKFTWVDGFWTLVLPGSTGTVEFKITRGSWATVEGSSSGGFVPNRSFTYLPNLKLKLQIAGWEDQKSGGNSTALARIKKLDMFIPQLGLTRKIWIYTPSDYDSNSKSYPVLYLHDAQNVFDNATAFAGEWGVDEALDLREKSGKSTAIVVAIEHGNAERLNEYSPYVNSRYGGGKGNLYVDFLANTLKPYIDSAYRTQKDLASTGIGGSSMGGLISMYAALKYPSVFGKALIFSPAFWFSDSLFTFAAASSPNQGLKVAFLCDDTESDEMVPDMLRMKNLLLGKGIDSANCSYTVKTDGAHSEWFWKREFPAAFEFLFPETSTTYLPKSAKISSDFQFYPNPLTGSELTWKASQTPDSILLIAQDGREILSFSGKEIKAGTPLKISSVAAGGYMLLVFYGDKRFQFPLIISPR
ncbi:MAG: hypothetical protein L6Q78_05305 [Bacteroidia bacterium]|nr:hypothetical protein [Bacteroidia bacterium]